MPKKVLLGALGGLFLVFVFWPWYTHQQAEQRKRNDRPLPCEIAGGYGVIQPDGSLKEYFVCSDGSTRLKSVIPAEEVNKADDEWEKQKKASPSQEQKHKKNRKESPGSGGKKKTAPKPDSPPLKIGGSWSENSMIKHAWSLSGGNLAFIYTIEAESQWRPKAVGHNTNGTTDHGLCQLNSQYHQSFIDSQSFDYWDQQLKYCWGVWQDATRKGRITTTFYGYNRRHEVAYRFK